MLVVYIEPKLQYKRLVIGSQTGALLSMLVDRSRRCVRATKVTVPECNLGNDTSRVAFGSPNQPIP